LAELAEASGRTVELAAVPPAFRRPVRIPSVHPEDLFTVGGAAASGLALAWLAYWELAPQPGILGFVLAWFAAFAFMYWLATRRMLGPLFAADRVIAVLIAAGAFVMLAPLVLVISFVAIKGFAVITPHFFTDTAEFCGQLDAATCGGVGHAIVGTLQQVGIATLISVPLAVSCAVFLNEIGGPLSRPVRLFVDAMSGVPSIVAGLFIYAVWVVGLQRGFSGFAASLALAILMLPTITRTAEVVLRLVPDGLREGSLALGGTEWRTTWQVVLPTARSGLITAVILGVARAVGETAPLILTAFGSSVMNADPLHGPQEALPHYVYQYIRFNPGTGPYQRAWAAAAVLTGLVLTLFTAARLAGSLMSIEAREARAGRRRARALAQMRPAMATGYGGAIPALPGLAGAAGAAPAQGQAVALECRRSRGRLLVLVAMVLLVLIAAGGYLVGGLLYAQAQNESASAAYNAVVNHQNDLTDVFSKLTAQISSVDFKNPTKESVAGAKALYQQLVASSQGVQPQLAGDDRSLADAQSQLGANQWLTVLSSSSLDTTSAKISHLRSAIGVAMTITADYVQYGDYNIALLDSTNDLIVLTDALSAHDAVGATTAVASLKADVAKAITLDRAPGLPPQVDAVTQNLQSVANDFDAVLKAAAAGDQKGATAAGAQLSADTKKLDTYDFNAIDLQSTAFFSNLIKQYNGYIDQMNRA
jgi:phosphate transport system permease protein